MIRKIIDTRNYLTHYDEQLKTLAASGIELWALCRKMEAIFQLHLLQVLGFTQEEIMSVFNKNENIKKKL